MALCCNFPPREGSSEKITSNAVDEDFEFWFSSGKIYDITLYFDNNQMKTT